MLKCPIPTSDWTLQHDNTYPDINAAKKIYQWEQNSRDFFHLGFRVNVKIVTLKCPIQPRIGHFNMITLIPTSLPPKKESSIGTKLSRIFFHLGFRVTVKIVTLKCPIPPRIGHFNMIPLIRHHCHQKKYISIGTKLSRIFFHLGFRLRTRHNIIKPEVSNTTSDWTLQTAC